jgi:uncharacterized protein (DUF3084 family)
LSEFNDFGDRIARAREEATPPEQAFADLLRGNGNGLQHDASLDELVDALKQAQIAAVSLAERHATLERREREVELRAAEVESLRSDLAARDESIIALERAHSEGHASIAAREAQIGARETEVAHREEAAAKWFAELSTAHRLISAREGESLRTAGRVDDDLTVRVQRLAE